MSPVVRTLSPELRGREPTAEVALPGFRPEIDRITCGANYPDPEMQACIEELRAQGHSEAPHFNGCGHSMPWIYSYRCVECGRFLHHVCILRHFEESIRANGGAA